MEDVNGDISSLVICELSQLADYNQPQAPGERLSHLALSVCDSKWCSVLMTDGFESDDDL